MKNLFKNNANEIVLNDAINKTSKCFKFLDVELEMYQKDYFDEDKIINEINDLGQKNFVYGYLEGVKDAVNNKYNEFHLKPESTNNCDYINNIDFAFIFHYSDNDFSCFIESTAKEYAKKITSIIRNINMYSSIDEGEFMTKSYINDLDYHFKDNFIKTYFQVVFLGEYIKNYYDYVDTDKEIAYDEALTKGKEISNDYLGFQDNNNWLFGTCSEIDGYSKETYEKTIDGKQYLWDNAETLIFKVKNGIVEHKII